MADNITPPPIAVPEDNTYLNYGPTITDVPGQQMYQDFPINIPNIQSSYAGPGDGQRDNFANLFNSATSKMNYEQGVSQYFPGESMMFDKYASSWDFTDKGFIPWRDQETQYNQDTNVFKELYRSSQFAAPLLYDGFTSALIKMVTGKFWGSQ